MTGIAALLVLAAAPAPEALFNEANAAFLSGDPARASALYQALIEEGVVSPELETNLGAALLRQGKTGHATLHFERALFLAPGDEDARADLAEARKGGIDRLEGEDGGSSGESLARTLSPLPAGAASIALLALWLSAFFMLVLRALAPALAVRLRLGTIAALSLAAAVPCGALAGAGAVARVLLLRRAVVTAATAAAREGPDPRSASAFELHAGTPLRLDEVRGDFARVRLANGLSGWLPRSAAEAVVPAAWGGRPF